MMTATPQTKGNNTPTNAPLAMYEAKVGLFSLVIIFVTGGVMPLSMFVVLLLLLLLLLLFVPCIENWNVNCSFALAVRALLECGWDGGVQHVLCYSFFRLAKLLLAVGCCFQCRR
jgi:hypothetical protein